MIVLSGSGMAAGAGEQSMFSVSAFVINVWIVLIQAALMAVIGQRMREQLGGMNGDISGYMIVSGEMAGVVMMAAAAGI